MYVISHVFSRRNAGDGLLVDLTLDACLDAGIPRDECLLLALDAESFHDFPRVVQAKGEPTARLTGRLIHAGALVAANSILGEIGDCALVGSTAKILSRAQAIIGVGGGYLVTDSFSRSIGVMLNHLTQLQSASRTDVPTIYMPQSVGPVPGFVGRKVANALKSVDRLYLRDDESMSELGSHPNMRRCADLAVLRLAQQIDKPQFSTRYGDKTVLVGRGLPLARGYPANLRQLAALLPEHSWAVQADISGPRSDRVFYDEIGVNACRSLAESLAEPDNGVVVSVRLHGAVAALLAGRPAIHLAYERKGWGAYEDLGLSEFVHDARNFDPNLVSEQARFLGGNSSEFWDRIRESSADLKTQYSGLVADLRARLLGN